ncbi:COMM domain-containing protein 5-like isoform X2 [Liolophura sinensis]|uniref:COMM domain-containing protein 5-like isoform X2 n=1 Tax=Liolophura sinensis TaxID=3198878 RepID=UPI00315908CB
MSIVHVTGGSGGGIAADRTLFVGPRIPREIKAMSKPLTNLDKATFRKLLQMIVAAMEGNDIGAKQFKDLQNDKLTEETLTMIYTGLYTLVEQALRQPQTSLKSDVFAEDLKELRIPEDFIADIASAVFGARRSKIEDYSLHNRPRLPKLENFSWRVDVGISTSALNRVLEPSVMMQMTLSDGKIHMFEQPAYW